MTRASLAMYDMLPPVQAANDRFWQGIASRLQRAGFSVPAALDREIAYHDIWLQPDMAFSQTCGYPYVSQLTGKVRLVATPVFSFAGGKGTERVSFLVVRDDSRFTDLKSLRGVVVAINDWGSNSGMNLLRAAFAPLAQEGRFFSEVKVSGGHVLSMKMVQDGLADVAAVDTVTWGMLALHKPEMLDGLRILADTPSGPGLPYITRLDASDDYVAALRTAIAETIADPDYTDAMAALGLTGIEVLTDADYDRLDAHRREAERLGYPIIA